MYEMEAAFWQYCWTKDSFSTLVTGLFILFPSCSSPHRFCRRLSGQLCASKAHDEKKVLWHIRFDLKQSIRCQDWAISASSKTLPVMILLNLRESGSPSRPTALPSRSRITDFSVIVQGCCVRVRAAAQVQDSRQIRVASLKEVSLNLQGGGETEKSIRGKKLYIGFHPRAKTKAWCSGKVDLVDTSEEDPHENLQKVSAGLPRGTKSNKLGGAGSCSSWAGTWKHF